jgi:hypothetical protein
MLGFVVGTCLITALYVIAPKCKDWQKLIEVNGMYKKCLLIII